MRVWTNGLLHAARTAKGLFLFKGTQFFRHFQPPDEGDRALLAVAPSGGHAWLSGLRRVSLEDGSVGEPASVSVIDLVCLDEDRVAVVIAGAKKKPPRLAMGAPGKPWEQEHPLVAAQAVQADFPSMIWPSVERYSWSSAGELGSGEEVRSIRLHAGPHGVAAVCGASGLVGVFRAGEAPWWLRVPVIAGGRLDAVATEGGALVTLVAGREGVAAHFTRDGRCTGHTGPTLQSVGAVPLAGGRFALFDDTKQGRVKVFDEAGCRDMHPRARLSLPRAPQDAAASPDGRWAVFGSEDSLSIFELGDKRLALVASLTPEDALREATAKVREKQRIEQGAQYKRSEGAPALGFPVTKTPVSAWEVVLGDELSLALALRSTGGPGRGVVVELSGPALAEGLASPLSVALADQQATPVRGPSGWQVTLEGVEIPRGMVFPFDPKPKAPEQTEKANALLAATHLDLRLRFSSNKAGSAMLTVAARSLAGTSAPMKWTRPFTVLAERRPPPPPVEPPPEGPAEGTGAGG